MSDAADKKIRVPERPWKDREREQLAEMVRAGLSIPEIAINLNRSPKSVAKQVKKIRSQRMEQLSTGVFFVGLAIVFLANFFWPGILFVFSATAVARALAGERSSLNGAMFMAGLGILFLPNSPIGFVEGILLLIGLSSIAGFLLRGRGVTARIERYERDAEAYEYAEKRKNDRLTDEDAEDYEKPKRSGYAMRLGDDGELIDIVDDEDTTGASRRR